MSATKMDLGKWFRHIEYLFGILNTIKDKDRFNEMSKSLLTTAKHVKNCMDNYLLKVKQTDVKIMSGRLSTLIVNLETNQYLSSKMLRKDPKAFESITFLEIEKWKQCIMFKVGMIMSLDKNSKHRQQCLNELKRAVETLKSYVKGYKLALIRKLKAKSSRKSSSKKSKSSRKSSSKKSKSSKKLLLKLKSKSKSSGKSRSKSMSRRTKKHMYKHKLHDLNIIHQQLNNVLINLGLARVSKNKTKSSKKKSSKKQVKKSSKKQVKKSSKKQVKKSSKKQVKKLVKKPSSVRALSSKSFYGL